LFQILKSPHVHDVAIIGSGAAGGMTAHVLTENRLDVVMLEAGPLRKPSEFPTHRMRRWNLPYRGLRGDYMQEWLEATHFLADPSREPYSWDGDEPFDGCAFGQWAVKAFSGQASRPAFRLTSSNRKMTTMRLGPSHTMILLRTITESRS
jgi:choline dehydrogenase-like flavoprotein